MKSKQKSFMVADILGLKIEKDEPAENRTSQGNANSTLKPTRMKPKCK